MAARRLDLTKISFPEGMEKRLYEPFAEPQSEAAANPVANAVKQELNSSKAAAPAPDAVSVWASALGKKKAMRSSSAYYSYSPQPTPYYAGSIHEVNFLLSSAGMIT